MIKNIINSNSGWNSYGRVLKYNSLEKAGLQYKRYIQGLQYWDTNSINSFSSFEDILTKDSSINWNGFIVTKKLGMSFSDKTLVSNYSSSFLVKISGFFKIKKASIYSFYSKQDNNFALRVGTSFGCITEINSNYSVILRVGLGTGYYPFVLYFADNGDNHFFDLKWGYEGLVGANDIPEDILFYKK